MSSKLWPSTRDLIPLAQVKPGGKSPVAAVSCWVVTGSLGGVGRPKGAGVGTVCSGRDRMYGAHSWLWHS